MKKIFAVVVALVLTTSLGFGQLALHDIGGGIGYTSVSFTSAGSSSQSLGGFLIAAHANLGELTKDLTLVPDIEYFSTSATVNGGTWKVGDFGINANVHYNIEMEGMVKPYAGAGLGLNFFSTTASASGPAYNPATQQFYTTTYSVTGSLTRLGINLFVGGNYKLNDKMTLFLEPRYVIASDVDNFQIKVGVTWAMM
ncbi:MAG: outer membrane beta-barrel protein [Bacteroidota bacterium]